MTPPQWAGDVHLVDLVIGFTVLEGLLIAAYHRLTGRGLAPTDYALNLLAGLCLMFALRCALFGWPELWIMLFLASSGVAHGTDLVLRWRRRAGERRHDRSERNH